MPAKPPVVDNEEAGNPNIHTLYKLLRDLGERVAKLEAKQTIELWALSLIITLLVTAGIAAVLVAK